MCLYPKIIKNRKYTKTKKNGGIIPEATDKRVLYVPVGCNKCMECKKQKARQWSVRMQEEIRHDKTGNFVTLTFTDEHIHKIIQGQDVNGKQITEPITKLTGYNLENEVATIAIRRYLERWRKKHKKSVKHWFVTELGQTKTERIHVHGIMWTKERQDIIDLWQYGIADNGKYCNESTVGYIVKYISKTDKEHKEYQSKILTSSGIGKGYTTRQDAKRNKYNKKKTSETYITRTGQKLNLPIYYRNKIYTEEEKEQLWLQKLDKAERWVDGKKIDISQGEEDYYKALNAAREKKRRLGYGDDTINWERKKYENERRNINKIKEIKKKGKIWDKKEKTK